MRHTLPIAPQFYVTAPQPCPYLDGRMERKLFTALQGDQAQRLNDTLSKQGFRRSQNVLYRPSCAECSACISARIRVSDFSPSRTQKRIMKAAAHLRRNATSPWATEDQFSLFRRYLDARHADGGMADMDVFEFAAMIEETPIRSRVIEYTRPNRPQESGRHLAAVCLTDLLDDGLSMVYSFYDPALMEASLGTYVVLDHIAIAREAGLAGGAIQCRVVHQESDTVCTQLHVALEGRIAILRAEPKRGQRVLRRQLAGAAVGDPAWIRPGT